MARTDYRGSVGIDVSLRVSILESENAMYVCERSRGMRKAFWAVMVLGVVGGLMLSGAGEAAPLSVEAKTDNQVKNLPQGKWRSLGALDKVKDKDLEVNYHVIS